MKSYTQRTTVTKITVYVAIVFFTKLFRFPRPLNIGAGVETRYSAHITLLKIFFNFSYLHTYLWSTKKKKKKESLNDIVLLHVSKQDDVSFRLRLLKQGNNAPELVRRQGRRQGLCYLLPVVYHLNMNLLFLCCFIFLVSFSCLDKYRKINSLTFTFSCEIR